MNREGRKNSKWVTDEQLRYIEYDIGDFEEERGHIWNGMWSEKSW
ncbi:hypothetical protein NSQ59_04050 [Margalitia sp. FSL K6-0131]